MTDLQPPRHLRGSARELWKKLAKDFPTSDATVTALLETAASCFSRAEGARRQLEREGSTYRDRFKQPRPHPAVAIERDARAGLVMALRALRLTMPPKVSAIPPRVRADLAAAAEQQEADEAWQRKVRAIERRLEREQRGNGEN